MDVPVVKSLCGALTLTICVLFGFDGLAQTKILQGDVHDVHSNETIPFASAQFKKKGSGDLTDSAGHFRIAFDEWPLDTLVITYVGYQDYVLAIDSALIAKAVNGVINVNILLQRGKYASEVIVRRKIDRGYLMWKRIVRRKKFNDRYRFQNFSYELYNKLELDFSNINKDRFGNLPLIKGFKFILDNVDSSEGKPVLPVYLAETVSDYYFQKNPLKRREVIKGTKTIGVSNESVSRLLGGMDQNINFYSNFIPVFDKQFVSPISDNGDNYYKYHVGDTQYVAGRRLIHLTFTAKRKGSNTFEGDCWVNDTTFAIQKMNLRLTKEANLNFVEELSLIQEYSLLRDSTWFLTKDKFVVDVAPLGGSRMSFVGRKTTTYRDIVVNDTSVMAQLDKNKLLEEVILPDTAKDKPDEYWRNSRHEGLTKTEQGVYKMVDTLLQTPQFRRAKNTLFFLTIGYADIGKLEIGPWYNWATYNVHEGFRLRWDLGTNKYFSKKWYLHGYAAYGFLDKEWKYKLDALYLINKSPRSYVSVAYKKDLDLGQTYYDEISSDNIFAIAIRKSGIPIKFMMVDEKRIDGFKSWNSGFSVTLSGLHKRFNPLENLPPKSIFSEINNEELATTEVSVRFRYAFLEKFLESTFNRISLGSTYPILDLKYTKGISGIFKSSYDYNKISASISHYKKIAPFGSIYYNIFGGQTFGTNPYYNKYAFNLMNKYEFVHDRYAGVNFEHNIGNGVLGFIPLLRKLKFRQFYSARALWGSLSEKNRQFNMSPNGDFAFRSLDGKTYLEVGTGIDNILKLFRIEFIWRLQPTPLPAAKAGRFGIFGSFRVAF
jgi:Family of unknown function (DUF5686)/CarboxypepD_reg-like domain